MSKTAPGKLILRLLGGLELDAPEAKSLPRKVKALTACVALHGSRGISRERLAGLFWEDRTEDQSRASLRQALSLLRRSLDDALVADDGIVRLDPAVVSVDVWDFDEEVAKTDAASLETASSIYVGDLLDGFSIREEAFEAWLRTERERLRNLMTTCLTHLLTDPSVSSDPARLISLGARLIEIDPLNEQGHRSLMAAYAVQGRYDAALMQFTRVRDILDRELGLRPQPETIALRARIRLERANPTPDAEARQNLGEKSADHETELGALGIELAIPPEPSLIVTPFRDLSGGRLDHLAEGLRIDIQSALVKISGLFVIAAGSAASYAGQDVGPEQISTEMGVRYVLTGAVRGSERRIRVSAELTDGLTGQVVWSERYDRDLDEDFVVPDEIVERIVAMLDVTVARGEQARVWRKTLRNPDALALYYKGLERLTQFDKQSVASARRLFERVSEISPEVTLGPTLVAFCHYWDVTMGWGEDSARSLLAATEWAERASQLEDADGQAHAILAHVRLLHGEHEEALRLAEVAISIRPQCATTNALYANILLWHGRPGEALDRVNFAIRAAPIYASWWVEILAAAYRDLGRLEMAEAAARELLRRKPDNLEASILLAGILAAQGRLDEAARIGAEVMSLDPDCSAENLARRHPYRCETDLEKLLGLLRSCGLPG
ncbi:BTAD domain-containing putative transcriptional regulator [Nioella aestuarii]|uniref:BTAD domain-containing putative transcriptional regulator n=1 Tax=Nioella aestuarii TaxID=1662864 RepID=UPI003D7F295B